MVKSLKRGFSSVAWLFSTFLILLLVLFLHSSSAYQTQRSYYPSVVPDETVKKIIIDALRKEWNGFKIPKSAKIMRPFYNIISPVDEVAALMDTLKEEEGGGNSERLQKVPDGGLLSNYAREEQENDQLNGIKIKSGGGVEAKNIYRLKESFPRLNEDGWEIDVPVGTRSSQRLRNNMFDEEKRDMEVKEDKDGNNGDEEENDAHNLPNYLSVAEIADKRTKRVMCHFKICNLGRRRRARFSSTPQGWLS